MSKEIINSDCDNLSSDHFVHLIPVALLSIVMYQQATDVPEIMATFCLTISLAPFALTT